MRALFGKRRFKDERFDLPAEQVRRLHWDIRDHRLKMEADYGTLRAANIDSDPDAAQAARDRIAAHEKAIADLRATLERFALVKTP